MFRSMLATAVALFCFFSGANPLRAQAVESSAPIEGVWLGQAQTPGEMKLQFHFTKESDGSWSCRFDEVERKRGDLPCELTWSGDQVAVRLGIATRFTGTLAGNTITGTLEGARGGPLVLSRETQAIAVPMADAAEPPTKDQLLRGGYGPYRANNDLLYYHLTLRVDPAKKYIKGSNDVRFRMLKDGSRIQLELAPELHIDSITMQGVPLHYTHEERTLWIDTPTVMHNGEVHDIVIAYEGTPVTEGRFGCFSWDKDKNGKPWITTACEGDGPSLWWPLKDQWRDEPQDGMDIDIAVPDGLMDVSNGRFEGSKDLGDGYTEWRWKVHYPINDYDVALNIGEYVHFSGGKHGGTTLDYYVMPYDLAKAEKQFQQVPTMLDAYEHYFGEYPFDKDGYKLVQVPYAGMEHQSAVAYGNHFVNSYYPSPDWTGVGISPRFDFILIHESGHEWFGNAVTAADMSDMWIHEGWTTYMESLYVEYRWGKADALKYINSLKWKVMNQRPIITPHGIDAEPPEDQYFKAALMINTLRSVIDDDAKWFADIHDFFQHFEYKNIMTEDVVAWWNARTGMDLTPFFNEYLRHANIPTLELKFNAAQHTVSYEWRADEPAFAMPIKVGDPAHWTVVTPVTTEWKTMPWNGTQADFKVATDLYYVNVNWEQR